MASGLIAIYRIIVLAAACVILWTGIRQFLLLREIDRQSEAWYSEEADTGLEELDVAGVPVDGALELEVWEAAYGENLLTLATESFPAVVPIIHRKTLTDEAIGLSLRSGPGDALDWIGTDCSADFIVNLAIVDLQTDRSQLLWDARVLVPLFASLRLGGRSYIVATLVDQDDNENGLLDCGDQAYVAVIDPITGDRVVSERKLPAEVFATRVLDDNTLVAAVGNEPIEILEIDLQSAAITPRPVPDLAGRAREAAAN